MKTALLDCTKKEKPNSSALGAFNVAIASGATEKQASDIASEVTKNTNENISKKAVTTRKLQRVENADKETLKMGIVAFQRVEFKYTFYGKEMTDYLDTKIMRDGSQIVIDGNGFIKAGYRLK